ncbi:type II toxin-antitoxin system RelB/DinJ family antitoxin [Helicobacter sp. MIT 01-3238]|uniref:type II toxin-antitoxin system RelB/DinJ family antitoxin n=1 Tax=Helicobacter sp. MIT 01-3238 TaxID=398627 RepID=UPI000E1E7291|nr:type II toxin-antitoxin system RelB/DinJ family antitoxin [Helicobacter sp. MIT 01-3238]RDU55755.1 hypothetical protein CQA40_00605 [Helicobacter sp. MIT 01-3238]
MNALVQVKVDRELKERAEELFSEFGLDTTTAIRMFLKAVVREQRIPLKLQKPKAKEQDPLYSPKNIAEIKKSIKSLEEGNGITMTYQQLEQFCDTMERATPQEAQDIINKVLKKEYFND